jgi:hypothetical protein
MRFGTEADTHPDMKWFMPSTLLVLFAFGLTAVAQDPIHLVLLDKTGVQLRSGDQQEWAEFPVTNLDSKWRVEFDCKWAEQESVLQLRQYDVKEAWTVELNDEKIGELQRDENPLLVFYSIPQELLRPSGNLLEIKSPSGKNSDDIAISEVQLRHSSREQVLNATTLTVSVKDSAGQLTPCRITIVNESGALVESGAISSQELAVRTGTIYTLTGRATIALPDGAYTIYAGRGFEYSIAEQQVSLEKADRSEIELSIRREVATPGYVACDTHVHSRTHSGHGDATVDERMITLAGEGIELPIATDHNVNIDHRPFAKALGADRYFTPVIGNEVTTRRGHFNIFPIANGTPAPDHRGEDWESIFQQIEACDGIRMIVLNHARDLHAGFRPFGNNVFNQLVAENIDGWQLRANGMEVINSGATQTDHMQLFHDWMALLNRGQKVTPIGSSDSHDVSRYIVGQGWTYVRCPDEDVSQIDVDLAVTNMVAGRVRVSYGLLLEMSVADRWTSGDTALVSGRVQVPVHIRVLGPHWTSADKIELFANGELLRSAAIDSSKRNGDGLIWEEEWTLDRPARDVFLTAIATGPGIDQVYWRTAKPYQPDSVDWTAHVVGCSGAIWLDNDGDGVFSSARDYAGKLIAQTLGDLDLLFRELGAYDEATALHAASLLQASGVDLLSDTVSDALRNAPEQVKNAVYQYIETWRESKLRKGSVLSN